MKTKLLPLAALLSLSAMSSAQAAAFVTDGYGNIARDNYGDCVRTSDWTKADAAQCTAPVAAAPAAKTTTAPVATSAAAPAAPKIDAGDIPTNAKGAYAVDSDGDVVRDSWNRCVRTNYWTAETAINKCEGIEEPKPAPVVVAAPAPAPAPVVETVVEGAPAAFRGFFDTNKADLKPVAHDELDNYSGYMTRNPAKNIKVTGHTDATGSEAYNQSLSEKRANAVKSYLTGKGIDGQRIEASGMGESAPIATNKTKAGRAENRRVELEVVK